jgi:NitT/TauT family transport system substrate-binding protein
MERIRTQTARYAALAAAVVAALGAFGAAAQEKVTFNMSWLPQGSIVGPVVAIERGWFKEAGLDVNIVRGYGGNRTANELDQGQFEVGYVDPISLVLNRSNGGKIKLVGAINTKWPGGICYVTSRVQAKSIDDLKGKLLGGGSASPVHNVVPAWLELNGKPKDLVRMLRMDPAVVDASLIEGKIDLAECWRGSTRAITQKQAAAAGVQVAWIEYSDFGLNAMERLSRCARPTRPEARRGAVPASYRGYEFAIANPEQAVDIMVKAFRPSTARWRCSRSARLGTDRRSDAPERSGSSARTDAPTIGFLRRPSNSRASRSGTSIQRVAEVNRGAALHGLGGA